MQLIELCQRLLPGNYEFRIEQFTVLQYKKLLVRFPETCQSIQEKLDFFFKLSNASSNKHNMQLSSFLDYLSGTHYLLYKKFRLQLLSIYFTDQDILKKLGLSTIPLYPNEKFLPDLNYDLLEPVYLRGEIWRKMQKNIPVDEVIGV